MSSLPFCVGNQSKHSEVVPIERMLIRGFAEILESKSNIECLRISDYTLANDKIDTK